MMWKNKISIIIAVLFVAQSAKSEARFPIWQDSLYVNESKHTKLIERCNFASIWTKDQRNAFTRAHEFSPGYTMSKILDQLNDENFDIIYNLQPTLIPYEHNGKTTNAVIDHSCNSLKRATLFVFDEFLKWYSGQKPYCFGLAHTKGECTFYSLYAATIFAIAGVGVAGSSTWTVSANIAPTIETENDEYAGGGPVGVAVKGLLYFLLDYGADKSLDATIKKIKNNPCKIQPDTWGGSPVTCTVTTIGD